MSGARDYAVALDGQRMTFECGRAGHRYTVDFSKRRLPSQRVPAWWLKRMLDYWGRRGGGVSAFKWRVVGRAAGRIRACPACRRDARAVVKGGTS